MALVGINQGTGTHNTAATTLTVFPAATIPRGSLAVFCVAYDNSGTSGADPFTSIDTSSSNAFQSVHNQVRTAAGAANDGLAVRIFITFVIDDLTPSESITVSFSTNVTAKVWTLTEVKSDVIGRYVAYRTSGAGSGNTSTPTVTSGTVNTGEMIFATIGSEIGEGSITPDSDTTNGSWSTNQQTAVGGAALTGMEIISQYKVVSASAGQTYNVATASSTDWCGVYAILNEVTKVSDIVACVGHWDATTGVTDAGSGAVSAWADQSGFSRNLSQATSTKRPTTGTRTIGGKNALDFDGSSDALLSGNITQAQPWTYYSVAKSDVTTSAASRWVWQAGTGGGPGLAMEWASTNWALYAGLFIDSATDVNTNPHLLSGVVNGSVSMLFLDRVFKVIGNAGTNQVTTEPFCVGSWSTGVEEFWDGTIGEIAIFSVSHWAFTRHIAEQLLQDKWLAVAAGAAGAATSSGTSVATVNHPAAALGSAVGSGTSVAGVSHSATAVGAAIGSGTASGTATAPGFGFASGPATSSGDSIATVSHFASAASGTTSSGIAVGLVNVTVFGQAVGAATSLGMAVGTAGPFFITSVPVSGVTLQESPEPPQEVFLRR